MRHLSRLSEQITPRRALPVAFENCLDPYLEWYDRTFAVKPQGEGYAVSTSPFIRMHILGRAQEEFEGWWDANCPNDPREDDFRDLFEGEIAEIGERITQEAVHYTVPLEHRRYFLDPDFWVVFQMHGTADHPAGPEEYYSFLDITQRPAGERLKRAMAFAREWARCPNSQRLLSTDSRPRSKPLESFRNRRRSTKSTPPRKSRVFTRRAD